MERQEAVECFTREAEPVLEEGKKLLPGIAGKDRAAFCGDLRRHP